VQTVNGRPQLPSTSRLVTPITEQTTSVELESGTGKGNSAQSHRHSKRLQSRDHQRSHCTRIENNRENTLPQSLVYSAAAPARALQKIVGVLGLGAVQVGYGFLFVGSRSFRPSASSMAFLASIVPHSPTTASQNLVAYIRHLHPSVSLPAHSMRRATIARRIAARCGRWRRARGLFGRVERILHEVYASHFLKR
jgi:hypothetical protein